MDMCTAVGDAGKPNGSVIALEGDPAVIDTQLLLLPISPKILILPSLTSRIFENVVSECFDAISFIRQVHQVYSDRAETAQSFLRSASSDQPRLVFVNGGCIRARSYCVWMICEQVTSGNIRLAEQILEEIIKTEAGGLLRPERGRASDTKRHAFRQRSMGQRTDQGMLMVNLQVMEEDPSVIAMRAADSLDRATASLQLSSEYDELETVENVPEKGPRRILSASAEYKSIANLKRHFDSLQQQSECRNFSRNNLRIKRKTPKPSNIDSAAFGKYQDSRISGSSPTSPFGPAKDKRSTFGPRPLTPFPLNSTLPRIPSHQRPTEQPNNLLQPDSNENGSSIPPTPVVLEFGEACIVDVKASKSPKRVKSVDRLFPDNITNADITITPSRQLKHTNSSHCLGGRKSPDMPTFVRSDSVGSFEDFPRQTFVKASETVIRRVGTPVRLPKYPSYVDRGTDPGEWIEPSTPRGSRESAELDVSGPLLPATEDFVIQLRDEKKDEVLETVVRVYKHEGYTSIKSLHDKHLIPSPISPSGTLSFDKETRRDSRETETTLLNNQDDEVDPFNPDSYPLYPQKIWTPSTNDYTHITSNVSPPTPATTPPPTGSGNSHRFHEVSTVNAESAVQLQNSLRAVLREQFLLETSGYSQHSFPIEHDRFWKPVFRNDTTNSNEGRTVDQILCLGCDDGMKRCFVQDITTRIEKLGMKDNGASKTGKLDIRYLITAAMQTFTSQPLTSQTSNPFANPSLLATLLIPHLESYLALNTSTQFLILTFPPPHLRTVLALRTQIGSDIVKIASITTTPAAISSRSPIQPLSPSPTAKNTFSNEATLALNARIQVGPSEAHIDPVPLDPAPELSAITCSSSDVPCNLPSHTSASQSANFTVSLSSTDSEILSFLTSIQSALIDVSDFYIPDPVVVRPLTPVSPRRAERADRAGAPSLRVMTDEVGMARSRSITSAKAAKVLGKAIVVRPGDEVVEGNREVGYQYYRGYHGLNSASDDKDGGLNDEDEYFRHREKKEMGQGLGGRERGRRDVLGVNEKDLEVELYADDEGERDLSTEREDALEKMFMPRCREGLGARRRDSRKALRWLGLA